MVFGTIWDHTTEPGECLEERYGGVPGAHCHGGHDRHVGQERGVCAGLGRHDEHSHCVLDLMAHLAARGVFAIKI